MLNDQANERDIESFNNAINTAKRILAKSINTQKVFSDELRQVTRRSSDDDNSVFIRVCTRLIVGEMRDIFRCEYDEGQCYSKQEEKEVEKLANKIGHEGWDRLVEVFLFLDVQYDRLFKIKPSESREHFKKQISLCRELSESLSVFNPCVLFQDLETSPFYGLIAQRIINESWISALESLINSRTPAVSSDIAWRCIGRLLCIDIGKFLAGLLQEFAEKIESGDIDKEVEFYLSPRIAGGKLSFKEYTKRVVYMLLDSSLPKPRRAPNKEAAMVANIILGLNGAEGVTANDISQMNKKTRRRYYKD